MSFELARVGGAEDPAALPKTGAEPGLIVGGAALALLVGVVLAGRRRAKRS